MMKKILLGLGAVVAVVAVLLLVPTSPALIVDAPEALLTIPTGGVNEWGEAVGLTITKYGAFVAAGTAAAIALAALVRGVKGRDAAGGAAAALCAGVGALVCSHLLFCAVRWSYIINDLCESPLFLVQPWKGGYTMYGAIVGALLGVFAYARVKKQPLAPLMDAVVPGMAALIALGRFAERYTLQGMGKYIDLAASGDIPLLGRSISEFMQNEPMSYLPFALKDDWGGFNMIVYNYEAIFAALTLAVTLVMLARKAPVGRAAETGLTLISLGQLIFESWRMDECIRFGFVRLNMIMAAVMLLAVLVLRLVRIGRREGFKPWSAVRTVLLFAGAGVIILIEFALDKSTINNSLLYAVMTLMLVMMGCSVLMGDGREKA